MIDFKPRLPLNNLILLQILSILVHALYCYTTIYYLYLFFLLSVSESEKEADEDEDAKSRPANGVSPPTAQPHSPFIQNSPNMEPKDTAGEDLDSDHEEEDTNSDQINGETAEGHFRESDSSGIHQNGNESEDSSEEKLSSTIPEQNGSARTLHEQHSKLSQEGTHTREDNQREMDKPVSERDSVGDSDETDKEQDLYLATSQLLPTPTKPDNRNTNIFQESPDTAHPANASLREDKEGQKKDEVAE